MNTKLEKGTNRGIYSEAEYRRRLRDTVGPVNNGDLAATLGGFHGRALQVIGMKRTQLNAALENCPDDMSQLPSRTVDECRVTLLLAELYNLINSVQ